MAVYNPAVMPKPTIPSYPKNNTTFGAKPNVRQVTNNMQNQGFRSRFATPDNTNARYTNARNQFNQTARSVVQRNQIQRNQMANAYGNASGTVKQVGTIGNRFLPNPSGSVTQDYVKTNDSMDYNGQKVAVYGKGQLGSVGGSSQEQIEADLASGAKTMPGAVWVVDKSGKMMQTTADQDSLDWFLNERGWALANGNGQIDDQDYYRMLRGEYSMGEQTQQKPQSDVNAQQLLGDFREAYQQNPHALNQQKLMDYYNQYNTNRLKELRAAYGLQWR